MATRDAVIRVSIAEGCIVCDVCETACPEVFRVHDGEVTILPAAQSADFARSLSDRIQAAARECPVDAIRLEVEAAEVKASVASAAAAAPVAAGVESGGDSAMQTLLATANARGGRQGVECDCRQPRPVAASRSGMKTRVTRGGFISAVAVGWAAVAATGVLMLTYLGRFFFPNVLEEPDPTLRVGPIERYATLAPGTVNEDFKPQGIWLYRSEDRLVAMSIICTHLGCIPNWQENDRKFKCPCHGSGFTEEGVNFEGPAPRPLERFAISVVDGQVVVDRSKKFLAMGPMATEVWDDPDAFISV